MLTNKGNSLDMYTTDIKKIYYNYFNIDFCVTRYDVKFKHQIQLVQ